MVGPGSNENIIKVQKSFVVMTVSKKEALKKKIGILRNISLIRGGGGSGILKL